MVAEAVTINAVNLKTLARNIEEISGFFRSAPRRGENILVPGRHGRLRIPYKMYDSAAFPLPIWIKGLDSTGIIPGGSSSSDEYRKNADALLRLVTAETLTIDHTWPDTEVRRAIAELVTDPLDLTREWGHPLFGRVVVPLVIPAAFWISTTVTTSGPFALTTGATQELTGFAGATAPMDELTITLGPGSNPILAQPLTGAYVAYDGVISSGRELTIDTATWLLGIGGGTAWTPDYSILRHSGSSGRLFELRPAASGGPVIQLTHSGGGTMNVTVAGRRKYLSG